MPHPLLQLTHHRPWPLPEQSWQFYQEWSDAIFLHYPVELAELKQWVPKALEIDLIEGQAWVSVVAFTMEKIRPRGLFAFPPLSDFYEVNIRTYVKTEGKTGVYFLSIEGGKVWSCRVARWVSELPYRFSVMERKGQHYRSDNPTFKDRLRITYTTGKAQAEKTDLDRWLTERYALFQDTADAINAFEIHHPEWPLEEIVIDKLEVAYPRFATLLGAGPSKVHYSPGVQVLAWGKNVLRRKTS